MDVLTYFLIAMSIAATLLSVVLLGIVLVGIWVVMWVKLMMKKFDQLADTTTELASSVKVFVAATTERAVAWEKMFLTVQGLQQVASHFSEAFHRKKAEVKAQSLTKKGDKV